MLFCSVGLRPQSYAVQESLLDSPAAFIQLENVAPTGFELEPGHMLIATVAVESSSIPAAGPSDRHRNARTSRDGASQQVGSPDVLALRRVGVELRADLVGLREVQVIDGHVGEVLHLQLDGAFARSSLDGHESGGSAA